MNTHSYTFPDTCIFITQTGMHVDMHHIQIHADIALHRPKQNKPSSSLEFQEIEDDTGHLAKHRVYSQEIRVQDLGVYGILGEFHMTGLRFRAYRYDVGA